MAANMVAANMLTRVVPSVLIVKRLLGLVMVNILFVSCSGPSEHAEEMVWVRESRCGIWHTTSMHCCDIYHIASTTLRACPDLRTPLGELGYAVGLC